MIRQPAQFFVGFAFLAVLFFVNPLFAQDYKIVAGATPPPAEIAAPVRALLAPGSLNVTGPSGPYCEIWLRSSIPAAAQPTTALGVAYGQLIDGEIFGAIHFDVPVIDLRNQNIQPGTYVLRYGLQPVDGNHQGVSDYRDFVLLTPPDQDTSVANLADNDMYALSRKASRVGHPSVWSLVPADSAPAALPGVSHDTNEDFWIIYFKATVGSSPITMGMVINGHVTLP